MKGSKHFILCVLCLMWLCATAQIDVQYSWVDGGSEAFRFKLKDQYDSAMELYGDLEDWRSKAYVKGYLAASVDSIIFREDSTHASVVLFVGQRLQYDNLRFTGVPDVVLRRSGLDKRQKRALDYAEVEQRIQGLLDYYVNNGYPFASVKATDWYADSLGNTLVVQAEPNEFIVFDTLTLRGEAFVRQGYMARYLGLLEGEPYSERKLNRVVERLAQLPFLTVAADPVVLFRPGKASVVINVDKQRANEVNFILGFLPNDQLDDDRRLTLTGDGTLHLVNSFGVGEEFSLAFKQIKPRTQDLEISAAYPFVANFPVGIGGRFHLYRNDTLFSQLGGLVSVDFRPAGNDRIGVFYENFSSNALTIDTQAIKRTEALPEILDVRNNTYGLQFTLSRLNDIVNPTKGRALHARFGVGTKQIVPRFEIENLRSDAGSPLNLYEDRRLRSVQYRIAVDWQRYTPFAKRFTLLTQYRAGFFIAQNVSQNEMYRIGGANLLRGFDEEVIFTPHYQVATAEVRWLLGRRSFVQAFVDFAVVEDAILRDGSLDTPVGFGVGAALSTKGGMFRISYALGRQLDQPIRFRNGKIHFGYVNVF